VTTPAKKLSNGRRHQPPERQLDGRAHHPERPAAQHQPAQASRQRHEQDDEDGRRFRQEGQAGRHAREQQVRPRLPCRVEPGKVDDAAECSDRGIRGQTRIQVRDAGVGHQERLERQQQPSEDAGASAEQSPAEQPRRHHPKRPDDGERPA
jgi:hypothetical protein